MPCRIESLAKTLNSQLSVLRAKAAGAEAKAADAEAKARDAEAKAAAAENKAAESEAKVAEADTKAAEAKVALQKTSETEEALKHKITELKQQLSQQLSKEVDNADLPLNTDLYQDMQAQQQNSLRSCYSSNPTLITDIQTQ